jgi:hypothetical protein
MATAVAQAALSAVEGSRMAVVGTTAPRVACAPLRVQQRQQQRRRGSMRVAAVASPVKPAPSGKPASGKAAAISKEEAAMLYHDMVLGREFEEMCAQMYYRGKMFGFVHLYSGQEAVSTGAPPPAPPHRFAACCSLMQPAAACSSSSSRGIWTLGGRPWGAPASGLASPARNLAAARAFLAGAPAPACM